MRIKNLLATLCFGIAIFVMGVSFLVPPSAEAACTGGLRGCSGTCATTSWGGPCLQCLGAAGLCPIQTPKILKADTILCGRVWEETWYCLGTCSGNCSCDNQTITFCGAILGIPC